MKKYAALTLFLAVLSLVPSLALSAGSITVKDTVAGLGAEITCTGFPPHEALSARLFPPLGAPAMLQGTTDDQGRAVIRVQGEETEMAGPYSVELLGTSAKATFQVLPDVLDAQESSIEADRTHLLPDGTDEARITVILRDRYLNPLGGHPVGLLSSRSGDMIRALTSETDLEGQQMFSLSTREPGSASLRAIDLLSGKPLNAQVTVSMEGAWGGRGGDSWTSDGGGNSWGNVTAVPVGEFRGRTLYGQLTAPTFDVIDHFKVEIEGGLTSIPIRQDTTFRVTANDRSDRTVEDYTGTIRFSSTDPKAILPFGTRQFAAKDLGVKTFTLGLRFNTGGEQTLAVEDTSGTVRGSVTVNVTGGGTTPGQSKITITEPKEGATINSPTVLLRGTSQPLINLIVTGGREIARGDTDENGAFQVAVALNTALTGATLQVEEANGKFKSNPLNLIIDLAGPRISAVEFSPHEPAEGQVTQVTVKTDPLSTPVTMTLEGTVTSLMEDPLAPGTFKGSFSAPAKAGTYQPLVTAQDKVGNKSEMLSSLTVKQKTPPTVRNLTAEPKVNAVALKWEPVAKDTADTYRVYVGDRADNFSYSLDTDASVSAATVAGLKQGMTYYFAVTALKNGIESAEKSNIASATVLGLRLTVTPGDASLLLQWNSIKQTTPLAAYLLEYGVEAEQLTEKRMVNGDADSYTLRDLINGVTYFLRLTPVSVPGQLLKDLAASAEGTPNGSGFHAVAGSGSEFELPPPSPPPPSVVKPGMPPITWAGIVVGAAALVFLFLHWQRRRTLRVTTDFLEHMHERYRTS